MNFLPDVTLYKRKLQNNDPILVKLVIEHLLSNEVGFRDI